MPAYYTVQFRFDRFFAENVEDEAKTNCSGIINLLFGVLVDYNTRGHFTHCSHFSSPQFVKYPRVLSTKTPNKVYILLSSMVAYDKSDIFFY